MKLSIDLGYILKRVIIGVLIALIIMFVKNNVFAASVRPTPTNCTLFYGSNSSNAGTLSTATYNSLPYRECTNSTARLWTAVKYNYQSVGISNGNYIIQFLIRNYSNRVSVPSVMILSGSQNGAYSTNACYVSASEGLYIEQPNTSTTSYSANSSILYYSVYCPNVEVRAGYIQVVIQGGSNNTAADSTGVYSISQDFNYSQIVSSSDIQTSIDNSSSQAHTDSQNTQNAINGVSNSLNDNTTSSNTNNANGIFNVDSSGQSTNSNVSNYGLESIITGPITMLQNAVVSCSPVSFTIFGKSISLPCGDSLFWNRDFSSQRSIFSSGVSGSQLNTTRNTFRDFWNLLFGGAIIFHLLVKLYETVQKVMDPMSDEFHSLSSAIDTSSVSAVRDTDGDVVLDEPRVMVKGV